MCSLATNAQVRRLLPANVVFEKRRHPLLLGGEGIKAGAGAGAGRRSRRGGGGGGGAIPGSRKVNVIYEKLSSF